MSADGAGELAPEPERQRSPGPGSGAGPGAGTGAGTGAVSGSVPQGPPAPDVLETAHEARLIQAGRMLAGIVHEIRNPLAVIQGYAQLLQEHLPDANDADDVGRIIQETKRLGALVDDMLSFVRRDGVQREGSVDLTRTVQAALNLTTHAMRQSAVTVIANLPEAGCHVKGQQGAYIQVLLNLLDNARESLEESGRTDRGIVLRIEDGTWDGACGDFWRVDVSNSGPPIPPAVAATIFESFFTTKQARSGTGLGLALCREILARFGGTICLVEQKGADAPVTFRLELPKA